MANEPSENLPTSFRCCVFALEPLATPKLPAVDSSAKTKCLTFNRFNTMKQIENSFVVTGFVGKDADIRGFENSAVARFSLAVRHGQKTGETTTYSSAFLQTEIWRKSADCKTFSLLKKGTLLTIEGFFKPEEWTDEETGAKRHHLVLVATKAYEAKDKPTEIVAEQAE